MSRVHLQGGLSGTGGLSLCTLNGKLASGLKHDGTSQEHLQQRVHNEHFLPQEIIHAWRVCARAKQASVV